MAPEGDEPRREPDPDEITFSSHVGPAPDTSEPLRDDDPGAPFASQVRRAHAEALTRTPGYVGSAVSRDRGQSVIVIFTSTPVTERDRIDALDGVPIFYTLGAPLEFDSNFVRRRPG